MDQTLETLVRHGYLILFLFVLVEQIGLPLPSIPVLLAAGALSRSGQLEFGFVVGLAVLAALASDVLWYEFGRRRGAGVLRLLCRVSIEPDSCVRSTHNVFERYGASSLLVAKFIPGLSTVAPPLAGVLRMPAWRFMVFDAAGALLWSGSFAGLGYLYSRQLESMAVQAGQIGGLAFAGGGLLVGGWLGWKLFQRRRLQRTARIERMLPDELNRMFQAGHPVTIVDMRHPLEVASQPVRIPGAMWIPAEELEARRDEIPEDREIVLYCA